MLRMLRIGNRIAVPFFCLLFVTHARAQVNVTTQHYDNARTGQNAQETILTPLNVNQNTFGKLYSVSIDGYAYAQPLYLSNLDIAGGIHNVVFVATEHDSVYAYDADDGTLYWRVSFINPTAGISSVASADVNCGDLQPEIGITATPVIDASVGTIYMVAKTKENGTFVQRLHALDVTNGAERPGSPVVIAASVSGTGDGSSKGILSFDPLKHLNRPGLLLQDGHVVIGWASHCDNGPYHGWVMSYNATSLTQEAVFNTTPTGGLGGVWMSGGGIAGDSSFNTYFATGNGTYDGNPNFGDSVMKLGEPSGSFPLQDWFTPNNQSTLSSGDVDLGSGGVVLLPDQPVGSPHPHLLTMGGKEGKLYLLDRDNMGHFHSQNDSQIVQSFTVEPGMWGKPAWWNNNLYIAGAADVGGPVGPLKVFSFNPATGLFSTSPSSSSSITFSFPAPTPVVSANGNSNAIVWLIQVNQANGTAPAVLRAYDANNLAVELYDSQQRSTDNAGYAVKFSVPVVANGKVYVGTQTQLSVYGLLSPVAALSLNPGAVAGGGVSTGTVTLNSPAPAGGLTVNLSSDNTAVVTVPDSLTVLQGDTSASFSVNTSVVADVTAVSIHADYSGVDRTATLTVQPWLSSLSLNPANLVGGNPATATITLNAPAPTGGAAVTLLSSDPSVAAVPDSVIVAPGMTAATFQVTTAAVPSVTSVNISATYLNTKSVTLTAYVAAGISSVALNPASVTGGFGSTGTITLNAAAPVGGVLVALSSSNTAVAGVPASVSVSANSSTASFSVSTQSVSTVNSVTISATYNGSANAVLAVNPLANFNPIRVNAAGGSYTDSQGHVWSADYGFSGGTAAVVSTPIANTVDDTLYQSERWGPFTYTFTVPAGGYSVTLKFAETAYTATGQRLFNVAINGTTVLTNFDIVAAAGAPNTAVDRTFAVNAGSGTNNMQLQFIHVAGQPDDPKINAIEIDGGGGTAPTITTQPASQTVTQGQTATFAVVASGSAPLSYQWREGGLNIVGATLASYTTPATVAADNAATFDVLVTNAVGGAASNLVTLTVNPPAPLTLSSVGLSPNSIIGGAISNGTVTLSGPAPAGGIVVALSSSNSAVATVPASVTVPANASAASFTVTTQSVTVPTNVTITGTYNGSTTAMLTVTFSLPTLNSVSLSPASVVGGTSSTGTVTLSAAAPSAGMTITLSDNSSAAATPASVTVPGGSVTAAFTIGTSPVASNTTVRISAVLNGTTKTATLTVNRPALLSLSLRPASVKGGTPSTATVNLSGPAPAGGTVVSLSDNKTFTSEPSSVTVPAGTTSAQFAVTTTSVTSSRTSTISGALSGTTKSATLTVTP